MSAAEADQKRVLEEQNQASNDILYKRKRQLQQIEKDQSNDGRRLKELQQRGEVLDGEIRNLMGAKDAHDAELSSAQAQMEQHKEKFDAHPAKNQRTEEQKAAALRLSNDTLEAVFRGALEELRRPDLLPLYEGMRREAGV